MEGEEGQNPGHVCGIPRAVSWATALGLLPHSSFIPSRVLEREGPPCKYASRSCHYPPPSSPDLHRLYAWAAASHGYRDSVTAISSPWTDCNPDRVMGMQATRGIRGLTVIEMKTCRQSDARILDFFAMISETSGAVPQAACRDQVSPLPVNT